MSSSLEQVWGSVLKANQCIVVKDFHGEGGFDYHEWKFTILRYLDYHGLRGFINGKASLGKQPTEEEKMEFMRKKITAYTVLRNSVREWLGSVGVDSSYHPRFLRARFDNTYDAKRLWDVIHECCDEEVFD